MYSIYRNVDDFSRSRLGHMSSWCFFGRTYFSYLDTMWHDGSGYEMCVRLGESGGRVNQDTVLAD